MLFRSFPLFSSAQLLELDAIAVRMKPSTFNALALLLLSSISLHCLKLVLREDTSSSLFTLDNRFINLKKIVKLQPGLRFSDDGERMLREGTFSLIGLQERYDIGLWGYKGVSPSTDKAETVLHDSAFNMDLFRLYSSEITDYGYYIAHKLRPSDISLPMSREQLFKVSQNVCGASWYIWLSEVLCTFIICSVILVLGWGSERVTRRVSDLCVLCSFALPFTLLVALWSISAITSAVHKQFSLDADHDIRAYVNSWVPKLLSLSLVVSVASTLFATRLREGLTGRAS